MKKAQMGIGKYIAGLLLMLGIPIGGSFFLLGGINNLLTYLNSDPMFVGIALISGLLFGMIIIRGTQAMNTGTYFFLALLVSVGSIIGYGFLNGDLLLGINKIMENFLLFVLFYVGGVLGGIVMGKPYW